MKSCKIIHINDGNPVTMENGNFFLLEEFPKMSEKLNEYLNDGWEVKHIIPDFDPAPIENGNGIAFYKTGFCVYLEK